MDHEPTSLTARGLARRLGPRAAVAGRSIRALYPLLAPAMCAGRTADGLEDSPLADPALDPPRLLAAMETYFAIVVTTLADRLLARPGHRERSEGSSLDATEILRCAQDDVARDVEHTLSIFDGLPLADDPAQGRDLFRDLYESLFPRRLRHRLGEYYTPAWLADLVLDRVGYQGDPRHRLLDPTCGSGVFLLRALARVRRRAVEGEERLAGGELAQAMLQSVVGFDVNPLAVLTAQAHFRLALRDLGIEPDAPVPVYRRNVLLEGPPGGTAGLPSSVDSQPDVEVAVQSAVNTAGQASSATRGCATGAFDFVVGNPPWIAWDHLAPEERQATLELWRRYGLFSLSGNEARHGGAKKDLSMLITYVAADRYLNAGGRLGFVITQTVFQTKGAGDGFRRFRLGASGPDLKVISADDLVAARPFAGASNWTGLLVLEKGAATQYPVPYVKWLPAEKRRSRVAQPPSAVSDGAPALREERCTARPVDPQRANSPWLVLPATGDVAQAVAGPSDYRAYLGANTGGANGVYWIEILEHSAQGLRIRNIVRRGKQDLPCVEAWIEPGLVYPLLRWGDVGRHRAEASGNLLLVQDPQTRRGIDESLLIERYPLTHAYLSHFRDVLVRRAAYRRYQQDAAFYSMYNVGPYTIAPLKVVWRRMDRRMQAAVVQERDVPGAGLRPVIPQETCVLIPVDTLDEAHYLCALLNSDPIDALLRAFSVAGGKGFGSPSILHSLGLRRFDASDPRHRELAEIGRQAHLVGRV